MSSGRAPTHHCSLDMGVLCTILMQDTEVPERLTQLQYEAENSAITKLLGSGTVLMGQLWLNGVSTIINS